MDGSRDLSPLLLGETADLLARTVGDDDQGTASETGCHQEVDVAAQRPRDDEQSPVRRLGLSGQLGVRRAAAVDIERERVRAGRVDRYEHITVRRDLGADVEE